MLATNLSVSAQERAESPHEKINRELKALEDSSRSFSKRKISHSNARMASEPSQDWGNPADFENLSLFGSEDGSTTLHHTAVDAQNNIYSIGDYSNHLSLAGKDLSSESVVRLPFLLKTDIEGNVQYLKNFASATDKQRATYGEQIIVTENALYVAGRFDNENLKIGSTILKPKGKRDAYLAKLDLSGNVLWAKSFGKDSLNVKRVILKEENEKLVLLSEGENDKNEIFVLDASANLLKKHTIDGAKVNDLELQGDELLLLGSYSNDISLDGNKLNFSFNSTYKELFFLHLDKDGNLLHKIDPSFSLRDGGFNYFRPSDFQGYKFHKLSDTTVNISGSFRSYRIPEDFVLEFGDLKSTKKIATSKENHIFWFDYNSKNKTASNLKIRSGGSELGSVRYYNNFTFKNSFLSEEAFYFYNKSTKEILNLYPLENEENTAYKKTLIHTLDENTGGVYDINFLNGNSVIVSDYKTGIFNQRAESLNFLSPIQKGWTITAQNSYGSITNVMTEVDADGNTYFLADFVGKVDMHGEKINGDGSFFVKISKDKKILESKTFVKTKTLFPNSSKRHLAVANNGDYAFLLVPEESTTIEGRTIDAGSMLVVYDKDNNLKWTKHLSSNGNGATVPFLAFDQNQNLVINIEYSSELKVDDAKVLDYRDYSNDSRGLTALLKFTSNGNLTWSKSLEADYLGMFDVDASGNTYWASELHQNHIFINHKKVMMPDSIRYGGIKLIKFNSDGERQWLRDFAYGERSQGYSWPTAISVSDEGKVYLSGAYGKTGKFGDFILGPKKEIGYNLNNNQSHTFTAQISTNGSVEWATPTYGSSKLYWFNTYTDIVHDDEGNVYWSGQLYSPEKGKKVSFNHVHEVKHEDSDIYSKTILVSNSKEGDINWIKTLDNTSSIDNLAVHDGKLILHDNSSLEFAENEEGHQFSDAFAVSMNLHSGSSVQPKPEKTIKPVGSTSVKQAESKSYSVSSIEGVNAYLWKLEPANAGIIHGDSNVVAITWANDFVGTTQLSVKAVNENGYSEPSEKLAITVNKITLQKPNKPIGYAIVAQGSYRINYLTSEVLGADLYEWEISPSNAGSFNWYPDSTKHQVGINWSDDYLGTAYVRVKAKNTLQETSFSEVLEVKIKEQGSDDIQSEANTLLKPNGAKLVYAGTEHVYHFIENTILNPSIIINPSWVGKTEELEGGKVKITWDNSFEGVAKVYLQSSSGAVESENLLVTVQKDTRPLEKLAQPSGNTKADLGSTEIYLTGLAEEGATYEWDLSPSTAGSLEINSNQVSITWAANFTGTASLKVRQTLDGRSSEYSDALNIEVKALVVLAKLEKPSGSAFVEQGESSTYQATGAVENAVYEWNLSPSSAGTITVSANQATIQWSSTFEGSANLSVRQTLEARSSEYSDVLSIEVKDLTSLPVLFKLAKPSGSALVEKGESSTYQATGAVENAVYEWNLSPISAGTITASGDQATIQWSSTFEGSANLSVRQTLEARSSEYSDVLSIEVKDLTSLPVLFKLEKPSGSALVEKGKISTYQATAAVTNAVYEWNLSPSSAGTITASANQATIQWSSTFEGTANLSVRQSLDGKSSEYSDALSIEVKALVVLAKLEKPSGSAFVEQGESSTYQATGAVENAVYEWNLSPSSAGTITASANQATIQWSSTFEGTANLSVRQTLEARSSEYSDALNIDLKKDIPVLGNEEVTEIQVYPNPSNGLVYVSDTSVKLVKLYDIQGVFVNYLKVKQGQMDLSAYASGLYFIVLEKGGEAISFRIQKL